MKLKEVGFSESIQLQDGHWIKVWAVIEGEEHDSSDDMWNNAKEEVKAQIMRETGNYSVGNNNRPIPAIIQAKEENEPEWCLVSDIRKCKELKVLESYKLIVKGKPELQQAYDEMYLKLSQ